MFACLGDTLLISIYIFLVIFLWILSYSIAFFCLSFNSNDSRFSGVWNFLKTTAKQPAASLNMGSGKPSSLHHYTLTVFMNPYPSFRDRLATGRLSYVKTGDICPTICKNRMNPLSTLVSVNFGEVVRRKNIKKNW